jgi:hypothetical protein
VIGAHHPASIDVSMIALDFHSYSMMMFLRAFSPANPFD